MTLPDWLSSGWLKRQSTSPQEIQDLLDKVDRDIAEAAKKEITLDWRLAIAYNACLGCATVALRASGYRMPGGNGRHYRTTQSLRFTISPDSDTIIIAGSYQQKESNRQLRCRRDYYQNRGDRNDGPCLRIAESTGRMVAN